MAENDKIMLENHNIATVEHEMRVDGHYLAEKKQKTVIGDEKDGEDMKTIVVHLRAIDNRYYKVTEVITSGEESKLDDHYRKHTGAKPFICRICGNAFSRTIETELKDDELEIFEQDWVRMWRPKIMSDGTISHAQDSVLDAE